MGHNVAKLWKSQIVSGSRRLDKLVVEVEGAHLWTDNYDQRAMQGILTGLGSSLKYILSKEETEWMSWRTSRSSYKSGSRSSSKATRSRWMLEEMPGGEFVKKC